MKGLTFKQYRQYKDAVNTFFKVQAYNTNIRNLRLQGVTTVSYYTFADTTEQKQYTLGRMLLIQNDPTNASSYVPVEKI